MLTPPTVHGFSFVLKAWGEMIVDSFEAILFDKHAYDHLELDEDHKVGDCVTVNESLPAC